MKLVKTLCLAIAFGGAGAEHHFDADQVLLPIG